MKVLHLDYFAEAEELLRLQYRASLDRIMKLSIYDNKSAYDIQFMVNEFMFNSGNNSLEVTRWTGIVTSEAGFGPTNIGDSYLQRDVSRCH